MVQRKEPKEPSKVTTPQSKIKKEFDQQERGSRERSDHSNKVMNKMISGMKTPTPTKKSFQGLAHYMKPTSSSDAKKGQNKEVNLRKHHSPTSCNTTSTGGGGNGSAHRSSAGRSSREFLKRKSMKRDKVLFAKFHVNRATCSSTLKDSKFPKALDLNPGGTEAEGTSVFRVCRYTYCSLNGHIHEPVPPLKSFLASRRKLIKTQQSMKMEGVSPFRKRNPGRDEKEGIVRMASCAKIAPLIEEVVNDFFVEIYDSKSNDDMKEVLEFEEQSKGYGEEIAKDCAVAHFLQEEEERLSGGGNLKEQSSSDMSCSDMSVEEMDSMMKQLEYVTCDWQYEAAEEKSGNAFGADHEEEHFCAYAVGESKLENPSDSRMDVVENLDHFSDSQSSESSYSGSDSVPGNCLKLSCIKDQCDTSIEDGGDVVAYEENILDAICEEESYQEREEVGEGFFSDDIAEGEVSESDCFKDNSLKIEIANPALSENVTDKDNAAEDDQNSKEDADGGCIELEISSCKLSDAAEQANVESELNTFSEKSEITEGHEKFENDQPEEANEISLKIEIANPVLSENVTDKDHAAEDDQNSKEDADGGCIEKGLEVSSCKLSDTAGEANVESELNTFSEKSKITEGHEKFENDQPEEANEVKEYGVDEMCIAFHEMSLRGDLSFDPTEGGGRNRLIIARRRRTEDVEHMRGFNPRGPNFLPLEPDPEGENVDLRHQMMDERKNAEEWMLDYALQRAVNKLAPARKKKVELLVEAFETVKPVPDYDKPVSDDSRR